MNTLKEKEIVSSTYLRAERVGLHRDLHFMRKFRLFEADPSCAMMYSLVIEEIEEKEQLQERDPNPLRPFSPKNYDQIGGKYVLGVTEEGYPFGLNLSDLKKHCAVYGGTGFGKSMILKILAAQIILDNEA